MMETKQIISWLLDKAARAQDHSYARMLNQAAKRLKELDQEQKWIPVAERLPEKDVLVLCVGSKGGMFLGCPRGVYGEDKCAYTYVPNSRGGRYTVYWMPLPEPPKDVTQNVTQSEPPNEVDR